MNEVFTKWREAIEYAEKRRGVRDFIENRQANALVECANEVRRLDMELARMLTGGSANVVLDRWGGRIVAAKRIASGTAQTSENGALIGDAHCIRELATEVERLSAAEARFAKVIEAALAWRKADKKGAVQSDKGITPEFGGTMLALKDASDALAAAIDAALKEGK